MYGTLLCLVLPALSGGRSCRSSTRPVHAAAASKSANTAEALAPVERPVEHLENLLVLRRFYRNCIRAQSYAYNTAPAYVPLTESEAEDLASDEEVDDAMAARKDDAMRALTDMQLISDQIKVCLGVVASTVRRRLEAPENLERRRMCMRNSSMAAQTSCM